MINIILAIINTIHHHYFDGLASLFDFHSDIL